MLKFQSTPITWANITTLFSNNIPRIYIYKKNRLNDAESFSYVSEFFI